MIRKDLVVDKEAYELILDGVQEMLLRFPLCGFSLLGESVEIRDATHEKPRLKTAATNGRTIWYNPTWMRQIPPQDVTFVLLHEWLHVFNNHVERIGDRDRKRWNIAADIYVNKTSAELLTDGPVERPVPSYLIQWETWAQGLTIEQIYEELSKPDKLPKIGDEDDELSSGDDIDFEGFDSESERDEWVTQFRDELAQSSMMHQQIRGALPGPLVSRLQKILSDRVPWARLLLGNMLDQLGHDVPTWAPLRRRFMPYLAMPSYRALKERKLVIAVDVSASVTNRLIQEFISLVTGAATRATEVHVIVFDEVVREVYRTRNPRNILSNVKFLAGAHSTTSVRGVFKLIDEIDPSSICIFTDGYVELPKQQYPKTLWVIPENGNVQAWGRTFVMEYAW